MKQNIKNIGIENLEKLVVSGREELKQRLQEQRLTAIYSDGSRKQFGIRWRDEELKEIEEQTEYTLHGTVILPEYEEILVEQRADPYVLKAEDGWYYFTASYPVCGTKENEAGIGYDRLVLRRAESIGGLKDAKEITIWEQKNSKRLFRYIWAPELHCINGSYYILFTGSLEENNVWGIRPHMLKCMGEDLMNPDNWNCKKEENLYRMEQGAQLPGQSLEEQKREEFEPFTHFSLDMTCFLHKGTYYVIWAEIPEKKSNLYIASVNKDEPWKLTSKPVLITTPEYDWEMRGNVMVNEGPSVLKHNGKIYVAFSASAVDYTYCVSFLEISEEADLLDADAWKKYDSPFLTSEDFANQCGPGHNSFTTDENGNVVLVYHARPYACSNAQDAEGNYGHCEYVEPGMSALSDPCRHVRAKAVNFAADKTPVLHMTAEEELLPEYREVSLQIQLKNSKQEI